jgi:hypothetical protein
MRSCSCACKRASNLSIVLCRRLRPIWARDVGWRACGCQRTRGRVRSLWRFGQRTFLHDFVAQGLETHATEARRWPSHAQRVPKLPDLADPDGCRSPADIPPSFRVVSCSLAFEKVKKQNPSRPGGGHGENHYLSRLPPTPPTLHCHLLESCG